MVAEQGRGQGDGFQKGPDLGQYHLPDAPPQDFSAVPHSAADTSASGSLLWARYLGEHLWFGLVWSHPPVKDIACEKKTWPFCVPAPYQ